jgi:hypothetical protein
MKRSHLSGGVLAFILMTLWMTPVTLRAQEGDGKPYSFSAGGDFVSSYLWRGTKFGTGPAMQPYAEFSIGGFAVGGWGSYCFTTNEGAEADLYASYSFDFGLSLGITDYYFPGYTRRLLADSTIASEPAGAKWFDFSKESGSHGIEMNVGYEIKGFSIAANYMVNEAGGAGTTGGDTYIELGYSTDHFGVFAGAGNGWYTVEDEGEDDLFAVCNIGLTASTELQITEKFALPVIGALILNPNTEQFHVVVGISF